MRLKAGKIHHSTLPYAILCRIVLLSFVKAGAKLNIQAVIMCLWTRGGIWVFLVRFFEKNANITILNQNAK